MIHFLDSSAIVKLYADEADHDVVRSLETPSIVSALARVEVPSALWRKNRIGELDDADTSLLVAAFETDWNRPIDERRFVAVGVSSARLSAAARLTGVHGLRAYDAVQLATAIAARREIPMCTSFSCFDRGLNRAAATEKFTILATESA